MDENTELSMDREMTFDAGFSAPSTAAEDAVSIQETHDARSVSSRQHIRSQLEADIQSFIAKGGAIAEVPALTMADPPRRPVSDYGSRPI